MSEIPGFRHICIYGVGLIGGAVGMAVGKCGVAQRVTGIGRNEEKLQAARDMGVIDDYVLNPDKAFTDCDLLILSVPPKVILEILPQIAGKLNPECIVTDAGSVKRKITAESEKYFENGPFFVGSHPLAGSEKTGCENAGDVNLKGATCFVALDKKTNRNAAARVSLFWKSLGMIPVVIHPDRHDEFAAAFSHVPHLASSALSVKGTRVEEDRNFIKHLVGSGYRDMTRLAAGYPELWLDICMNNRTEIVKDLDGLISILEEFRSAIDREDQSRIRHLLEDARGFQKSL